MKVVLFILIFVVVSSYASVDAILHRGSWITFKVTDEFSDETEYKIFASSIDGSVDILIFDDNWFILTWGSTFSRGQAVYFRVDALCVP